MIVLKELCCMTVIFIILNTFCSIKTMINVLPHFEVNTISAPICICNSARMINWHGQDVG